MKKIELDSVGENYIIISFENEDGKRQQTMINEPQAIEAIMVLGKALLKKSFLSK